MSRDITWNDTDPATGAKRWVSAEKFARQWHFRVKAHRRDEWTRTTRISRVMWEDLLDAMTRRYQRREGVSDEDLAYVQGMLAKYPEADDSVN